MRFIKSTQFPFRLLVIESAMRTTFANELIAKMSKQALDSEAVREGLKEVLLGPGRLYEAYVYLPVAGATK